MFLKRIMFAASLGLGITLAAGCCHHHQPTSCPTTCPRPAIVNTVPIQQPPCCPGPGAPMVPPPGPGVVPPVPPPNPVFTPQSKTGVIVPNQYPY
jgi:hypothetical protein